MKSDTFTFKTSDGIQIFTYRWMPDEASAVKGTVQVAHGMAEHAARYERFAGSLTKAGYAVYANDHRGHGKTAGSQDAVGYFADEHGWEKVVEDMHTEPFRQSSTPPRPAHFCRAPGRAPRPPFRTASGTGRRVLAPRLPGDR